MAKRVIFAVLLLVILAAVYGVLQLDQFHGLLLLAPLKQWYRKRHIDEVHSKWGHSYAKMIGCFLGTGLILTIAGAVGISPWSMFRQ